MVMAGIFFMITLLSIITLTKQNKTLVTFNVGLTRTVPFYEERMVPVVEALKKETADVICIQEAWNGIDVNNIINGVKSRYKYSYSRIHRCGGGLRPGPACRLSDEAKVECFARKCFNFSNPADKINCMSNQCSLMIMEQTCRTCVLLSEPKLQTIIKDCFKSEHQFNTDGLLLLSKEPICNIRLIDFEPNVRQLAPRAYIKAKVIGLGQVICTHLTMGLGPDYVEPNLDKYGSWEKQNFAEVKTLIKETRKKEKVVIMGTLNTGPSIPNMSFIGGFHESYQELKKSGLRSGYVDFSPECNLCTGNPFNKGFIKDSSIANHILTKGYKVTNARRKYTENITGRQYPLSYHYGAEVTIHDEQSSLK